MKSIPIVLLVLVVAAASAYGLSVISSKNANVQQSTETNFSGNSVLATSNQTGVTVTANDSGNVDQCPASQNASKVQNSGFVLLTCLSTVAKVGSNVDIQATVRDESGSAPYDVGGGSVTIRNGTGQAVFQVICVASQPFTLSVGKVYGCGAVWHTGVAYQGILPGTGVYSVHIDIPDVPGMISDTNITLTN